PKSVGASVDNMFAIGYAPYLAGTVAFWSKNRQPLRRFPFSASGFSDAWLEDDITHRVRKRICG
ncbi:hypothetical protein, partial [Pseudomonas viridiflava]|uniref:hypothetical protein n=1 Tax=Pseudomonas viridiflava TaxID=33069 RepID=UPI00197F43E6